MFNWSTSIQCIRRGYGPFAICRWFRHWSFTIRAVVVNWYGHALGHGFAWCRYSCSSSHRPFSGRWTSGWLVRQNLPWLRMPTNIWDAQKPNRLSATENHWIHRGVKIWNRWGTFSRLLTGLNLGRGRTNQDEKNIFEVNNDPGR